MSQPTVKIPSIVLRLRTCQGLIKVIDVVGTLFCILVNFMYFFRIPKNSKEVQIIPNHLKNYAHFDKISVGFGPAMSVVVLNRKKLY